MRRLTILLVLLSIPAATLADTVVVFNEIMYHPATNEPALEWLELYNQNAVDVDLGGWRITDAIDYAFPSGTIIKGGGYLVVALSPATLIAAGVTNVVGPFSGRLSNSGELLRLRDINNRLMDSVNYGVDGSWPVAADGGGPSLAKKSPNLASGPSDNWTASGQIGGSPGVANFTTAPLTGARTNLLPVTATWRYQDNGSDLGSAWRLPGYDDSSWATGAGLFFAGGTPLPAPTNTALVPGRSTYYFRTTFPVDADPATKIVSFRPVVDDGAVFYVNGAEVSRLNMPSGVISNSTAAALTVFNPDFTGPFAIPSSNLVAGQNVLAVELHQSASTTNSGLRLVNAATYATTWDGNDGDFSTTASPAPAPDNVARQTAGVDLFTSSNPGQASFLNDGRYGSSSSWSPATNDSTPYVIIRFNQTLQINSIAWSRDNGDTNEAACGGTCADRALGNYSFQYTMATNPAVVTLNSTNPTNGWATVATVQFLSAQPGFRPHLRHRFDFASTSGRPILATGVRLRPPTASTLDEIEINPPVLSTFDAVFGLELTSTDILPPPPKLVFNEISAASASAFWLEIMNRGDTPIDLGGMEIVRSGAGAGAYSFSPETLPPGAIRAITQAQLGFGAAAKDKLLLYTAGRNLVLDAVTVQANVRGRSPDGSGSWLYPAQATPGASNTFQLHDEIVFNEIMYRAEPLDPVPPVTSNVTAIVITNAWRYNDSGTDLGTAWHSPGYDDSSWAAGSGLFYFNAGLLPARTNTALAAGRSTYYFRTTFPSDGAISNLTLNLRSIVDDGAVFYLNGTEIYRQNMPSGPVDYSTSASGPVGNAGYVGPITLPANNLVSGVNVLAVEVHQITSATTSTGIVLSGGGLTLVEEGPFGGSPPMNLALQPGVTPFVIDSLAGYPIHDYLHLNDGVYGNANSWIGNSGSPGYAGLRFGGLFTISSIAFGRDNTGTFSDRTLGLYTLQYTRVSSPGTSTTVTGNADTGWATIGTLNYQNAGTGLFGNPSRRHRFTFTPVDATGIRLLVPGTGLSAGTDIDELEVNPPETSNDIAFGAELVLTTTLSPAVPFTKSKEQWIELYNRSTNAVDLSNWQIDGGISYQFPSNTIVPAGAYCVVANDRVALSAKWPEVASIILGDFSGKISDGNKLELKDAAGNPVNSLRLQSGGWSDGGGSSLELIDPRTDNSNPAAWADSDESGRSAWQTITYRFMAGQKYGNVFWNEFRVGMLDSGEALIDDVSVFRDPDGTRQQLIQNGDFENATGNTHWRMLGDHGESQIIVDPTNPGNHVLKVSATSPARTSHNHIESSFVNNTPLVDGQEYEVSFRARWLAGSPQIDTSAYFQKLAQTTILPVPARNGTPGAPNSRYLPNTGPLFSGLRHAPVIPRTNESVTVSVRAADPDGVAAVNLVFRLNPTSVFTTVPMNLQPDGTWTGTIPPQGAGQIVQFYVTGQDGLGATAFAPSAGPNSRALYQVADSQGANLLAHELRLIQLDADRDFLLNSTNVMSQARLGGTVIYDRSEVFYEVGVRLHGSAAGRARDGDDYISYDIAFPPDHLFRGAQADIGIDRSGRAPVVRQQHEIFILHMFQRAGLPCHHDDLTYFIAPKTTHSGTAILQLGAYNGLFVDEQFNTDGSVFNFDLTYEPSTTVGGNYEGVKLPVPLLGQIGTDLADLGNDKEQYRSPFDIRHGERADDFSGIIRLCQTMGSPQPQFDAQIGTALDVNEALRVTALTILCGIGDIYFSATPSLPHNLRIFTPSNGGVAEFLPWDMDFVFTQDPASSIFPTSSANVSKFVNNTNTRRLYLWHVNDLCQAIFNTSYMAPWLAHYGSVVGQDYTGSVTYIQNRHNAALAQLPAAVPFAITSNNGKGFSVSSNFVVLSGSGWLDVGAIEVNGVPYALNWVSVTNWSMLVPLVSGTNSLLIQGVDRTGARPPSLSASINITNTTPPGNLPIIINEWMASSTGPGGLIDPIGGAFEDWFELFNPNNVPVDLGGYYLTDDLSQPAKWAVPTNTLISAHGFLLVWADSNPEQNSPTNADLHASFKLNASGESLGLFAPDGISPQHVVTFGPQFPNVSQGLFPDGAVGGSYYFMTNWTPRASNRLGSPAPAQITSVLLQGGLVTFTFSGTEARAYRLEFKDTLAAPAWTELQDVRPVNGTATLNLTIDPIPQRFFRLRLL